MITATIDGVAATLQSLEIETILNGRDTSTMLVQSEDGSVIPELDKEVFVYEDSDVVFGGEIDEPEIGALGDAPPPALESYLSNIDFNAYMDRRYVNSTIPAGTLKQALIALEPYLTPYGVSLDPAQIDGPMLPELNYNWRLFKDCMDEIVVLAGNASSGPPYIHEITSDKLFHVIVPGSLSAPFNITDTNEKTIGRVKIISKRGPDYANRIVVKYQSTNTITDSFTAEEGQVTFPLSTPYSADPGYLTVNGVPNVPFGSDWTVTQIGVDTTLNGRFAYVYGSFTNWNSYRPGDSGNPNPATQDLYDEAVATWGATGNWNAERVVVSLSGWALIASAGQSGGTTVDLVYTSAYPSVEIADHAAQQLAHRIFEIVLDAPDVTTAASAQTLAQSYLIPHAIIQTEVHYPTYEKGLKKGQTQQITTAACGGFDESCLITEIRMALEETRLRKDVVAVKGSTLQSNWRDVYTQWSGGGGSNAVSVSGSGSSGTARRTVYFLGGSLTEYVQSSGPVAIAASAIRVTLDTAILGTTIANAFIRVRARSGSVTPIVRDVTNNTDVYTGAAVTSTDFVDLYFSFTLTIGRNVYELQVLPSLADTDVAAVGYVEI